MHRVAAAAAAFAMSIVGTAVAAVPASAAETDLGTISGTVTAPNVTDARWREAIAVTAYRADAPDKTSSHSVGTALLGTDGAFIITDVPAGEYVLGFEMFGGGYYDIELGRQVAPSIVPEFSGDVTDFFEAVPFAVAAGQSVTGQDAELIPGAIISGTITAPGVDGFTANMTSVRVMDVTGWTIDQCNGWEDVVEEYRCQNLAPGDYLLHFDARTYSDGENEVATGLPEQFHDSSTRLEDVTPITVTEGGIVTYDVVLAKPPVDPTDGPSITGTVTAPDDAADGWWEGVSVDAIASNGDTYGADEPLDEDGSYAFSDLPAGDYVVRTSADAYPPLDGDDGDAWVDPNLVGSFYPGALLLADAMRVTVADDATAAGIDFELLEGGTITGTVTAPSGYSVEGVQVRAELANPGISDDDVADTGRCSELAADGTYACTGLPDIEHVVGFVAPQVAQAGWGTYALLASEWYLDAPDRETAVAVTTLSGRTEPGIDGTLLAAPTFTIVPTATVTGVPAVGGTVGVSAPQWTPAREFTAVQWLRDGEPIDRATTMSYVLTEDDADAQITAAVTGCAANVGCRTVGSNAVSIGTQRPWTSTTAPTVAGATTAGSTLTATVGTWDPVPTTLAYQWYRSGAAIPGATASAYVLTDADRGGTITVQVTATRSGYADTSRSSADLYIPNVFARAPIPAISGTLTAGSTLTAKTGTWSPAATLTYRWYRSGKAITGATAATYTLTTTDRGDDITVKVTGTLAGYTTVTKTSAAKHVPNVFTRAPIPAISGTLKAGSTLTAKTGTWSPAATLTYQWYRSGKAITGATKSTYTLTTTDRGDNITVRVTGKRTGYTTTAKTSSAKYVPNVFSKAPTPTISGTTTVGKTVKVKVGTWAPKPSFTYRWYRDGKAITGATKASYKLTASDRGHKITVKVTGKRTGYASLTKASAAKRIA